jgi:transposase
MPRPLVSDEVWELVEPLIPTVPRRHRFPGHKRIDDRKVLTGILFVLRTGIPWEYLTQEMGRGSGVTCWRRLREWQEAGVWQRLRELLLANLNEADLIDFASRPHPACESARHPRRPPVVAGHSRKPDDRST